MLEYICIRVAVTIATPLMTEFHSSDFSGGWKYIPWMNSNSLSMRCPACLVFPLLTESYFQTYFRFGIGFLGALFIFFGGYSNVELCYSLTRELVDINSDPRGNYAQLLYRVNHNKVKGQQYADWKMFLKRNCSV